MGSTLLLIERTTIDPPVIGSIVGTRQDLAEVFALHAAGKTKVIAETRTIDQVNDAMAEVLSGKVPARLVFEF